MFSMDHLHYTGLFCENKKITSENGIGKYEIVLS